MPHDVRLIADRGFSEAELQSALDNTHDPVYRHEDVENAFSMYDIKTGVVTVKAQPRDALSAAERLRLRTALQPAQPANRNILVNLVWTDDLPRVQELDHLHGGGHLDVINGGCTAGFGVESNITQARGLLSAGHCVEALPDVVYRQHGDAGLGTSMFGVDQHQGEFGDLGWYLTNTLHPADATFYFEFSELRTVDSVHSPVVNQVLCRYGRTSGTSCPTVAFIDVTIGPFGHMAVSDYSGLLPGDSGGPWYWGGFAYGITRGVLTNSQLEPIWDLWTQVESADEALDVTVLTG